MNSNILNQYDMNISEIEQRLRKKMLNIYKNNDKTKNDCQFNDENNIKFLKRITKETMEDEKFKQIINIEMNKTNDIIVNGEILYLIKDISDIDKKILSKKWNNLSLTKIEKKSLIDNIIISMMHSSDSAGFYNMIIQKLCYLHDKPNMDELKEDMNKIQNNINDKMKNFYMNLLIYSDYKEELNNYNYSNFFNILHRYILWQMDIQRYKLIDIFTQIINIEYLN